MKTLEFILEHWAVCGGAGLLVLSWILCAFSVEELPADDERF